MSLTKFATFDSAEVLEVKGSSTARTATFTTLADFENYRTGDGYLYVRIRAISSRCNRNHDGWPSVELAGSPEIFERHHSGSGFTVEAAQGNQEYGFATFVGKPVFVDHHNSNPKKARGVIKDAKFNVLDHRVSSNDHYWGSHDVDPEHLPPAEVELLLEVDATSFPRLAKAIISGDLDGFSMGCDIDYSKCSHCGHVASAPDEYCSHIMMKGAHHDFKTADGHRVSKKSYENCYGVRFFEISAVFDPADETALAREVRSAINKEADIQPMLPQRPDPIRQDDQVADLAMAYQLKGIDPETALDLAQRQVEKERGTPGYGEGGSTDDMYNHPFQYDRMPVPTPEQHNDPRWSHKTAQNPMPQEFMTRAPDDIDTLRQEELCPICFIPGTLVRTARGTIPIESVTPGDLVLTSSGEFYPVLQRLERDYDGDLLGIDVGVASDPIWTTPNHPFKVLWANHQGQCRPGHCDKSKRPPEARHKLAWVCAEHLTTDNYLVVNVPRVSIHRNHIEIPGRYCSSRRNGPNELPLTDDILWALGLYLAEGSDGARELTFSLHRNESEYQNRIRRIFEDLGYTTRLTIRKDKPNSAWVHVHSSTLAEWFGEWLGHGCDQKHIPGELLNLPNDKLQYLLQGILDGDGCEVSDTLKQTSSVLASQVIEISRRLERPYLATVSRFETEGKKTAYTIPNAGGTGALKVANPLRQMRYGQGKWAFQDRQLQRIRHITKAPYQGKVYNLEVAGDHTYTVQNILVHNCGNDMDSETCQICGYVQPPKEFDNPDLDKATEIREKMKSQEEEQALSTQPGTQPGEQLGQPTDKPGGGPLTSQMPTKAPATANLKSEMRWTPKVHPKTAARINQVERPITPSNPPISDEPQGAVVIKDQMQPVTSSVTPTMVTAQRLMANAQRNHGEQMNTRTADGPTPPGDTSPKTQVDVTGVGGVDEASNEAASKADAQVDVTGIGTTGVSDVSADSSESLPTAGSDSNDAGFNTDKTTEDSGPTSTFPDKDGQHPGVTDPVTNQPFPASEDGVKAAGRLAYDDNTLEQNEQQGNKPVAQGGSAVQGVQPVDSVATPGYKRVNVLEHATSPSNNSGETKTWSGTDGNGVLRQQEPITNESQEWGGVKVPDVQLHTGKVSLAAIRLAEMEVELGLIAPHEKWNRMAEFDVMEVAQRNAQLEAYSKVKTAGLAKLAQHRQSSVTRLPKAFGKNTAGFQRIAHGPEESEAHPVTDEALDAGLFLK